MGSLHLLFWTVFVHLTGIYLFTRGFLLSRLSLSEFTDCSTRPCVAGTTHTRAVILIIDALRFDFLSPDVPEPESPFHHRIITLPSELTAQNPHSSFLFNAYADPPTATLQRIKAITTGSLPTFIDIGNNFGGSSIAEDSLLKQLQSAGKKVAFMGDDTWMSVFPDTFQPNMSFPFDSFNVEDLHTVDEGVITNLFPLLEDKTKPFDFLIGHFLGVDHVGHRVGPDHPSMKAKLTQMNDVLKRVVNLLEDDTLLVVLGDHGMDHSGDHGGDGEHETSSALWIYSKRPVTSSATLSPAELRPNALFPGTTVPHRRVQQIDLLPTLSLLLGIPISFNNLGSVIPELFPGPILLEALALNARQIHTYLDTYRASASGGELDDAWPALSAAWTVAENAPRDERITMLHNYNRLALVTCRALWAQFNAVLMGMGLALLAFGLIASWAMYSSLSQTEIANRREKIDTLLASSLRGGAGGAVIGFVAYNFIESYIPGIDSLDCVLFAASLVSALVITTIASPAIPRPSSISIAHVTLILHTLAFFSNSFVFWEDRFIPFLLITSLTPHVLKGFTAPTRRLRLRILGFSALFAVCVRLMALSTVCREEQQPYCTVTFFSGSSPSPPRLVLAFAMPTAIFLPWIITRFLQTSRSDVGLAKTFYPFVLTPALIAGTAFWIIEWVDASGISNNEFLRPGRTIIGRMAFGILGIAGLSLWWAMPLCLQVSRDDTKTQVQIIGFGNAYGASYLLAWTILFGMIYTTTQLSGQIALALSVIALLSHLEIIDSVRDVRDFDKAFASLTPSAVLNGKVTSISSLQFTDIVPVALLGLQAFYSTGHQSTISSLQWKSAFVLVETVSYPLAPSTVVMNSLGMFFLAGLVIPLLVLWNQTPPFVNDPDNEVFHKMNTDTSLAGLGIMTYYGSLLFGTALSAAILRRHLMVWKLFAPRFMAAVLELVAVDLGVLVGVGIGVSHVLKKVAGLFSDKK